MGWWMWRALRGVVLGQCALLSACVGGGAQAGAPVVLIAPASADDDALVHETARYLEAVSGGAVPVHRVERPTTDSIDAAARAQRAALAVVLKGGTFASARIGAERLERLGDSGFVVDAYESGQWRAVDGGSGATVVLLDGATVLSRQYATYELLRRLGVRFFHPEQEYVPQHQPTQLRELAQQPTILHREGADYMPDYASRSWSFHSSHPLEHLEAFSDARVPIDEARNVNTWVVKNRGNRFRGPGRGVAPPQARAQREAELQELRVQLGLGHGTGITLHNEQQGASAEIDRTRGDARAQIEAIVARRLREQPDAQDFRIHFGPTEFTTTPDTETVDWINWAGRAALALRPDISVWTNVHITGAQPTPNFDDLGCPTGTNIDGLGDYYDLAFHADNQLGAMVHTVMFYPLEGDARVYNQQTFAHKLCLMQQASQQGRPLAWFPEGSWWLSFDNSVPVYLPLYLWTRGRDNELLKPLLASRGDGTLTDFRMFNSGHEWGYWQQDYAVGLWAWNADVTLQQVLGELFDPLCEPELLQHGCAARTEAIAVLQAFISHQRELFLERSDVQGRPGGLFMYFAGEDRADEIASASGVEFRPVRVSFAEVASWDADMLDTFVDTDLAMLEHSGARSHAWADRLAALDVSPAGQPWVAEVIDGIRIHALRAAHTTAVYGAVVNYRKAALGTAGAREAAASALARAAELVVRAEAVVRRREAAYRYPAEQTHGGGLSPDTAVANGTTYGYRVHTKTHHLTYWRNRQQQAEALVAGQNSPDPQALSIQDAIAAPGQDLQVTWPDIDGLSGSVTVGERRITPSQQLLSLGEEVGYWPVKGDLSASGTSIAAAGGVARSHVRAVTPEAGTTLLEPQDPLAQAALAFALPAFHWAYLAHEPAALVFATDPDANDAVEYYEVVQAPIADASDSVFVTEPVSFSLSVSGAELQLQLSEMVFRGSLREQSLLDPIAFRGAISVRSLVSALGELAGFDEEGALRTLSGVLGFDRNNPPTTVPFAGEFSLIPDLDDNR